MKRNILYLNVNSSLGGVERRLLSEVRALNKDKFSPLVCLFYKGPLVNELSKFGIPLHIFPTPYNLLKLTKDSLSLSILIRLPAAFIESLILLFRILNLLKKKDIDIIVSYTFKMHILSIFIKPLLARIIWQYCDLLPENKILKKIVLLIAGLIPEKIITNSNYVKEEFTRNNIHEDKVVSFYDGFILRDLSVSEKERVEFRNKFNLSSEDFAVGCLGALVEWKGQEYLIRATKIIQGQIPHLRIFIIGDKIYDTATKGTKEYLMNLVNELGLADIVTFTGFINENRQIISVLDLIVHTSIKPEPFGRVVVEGMLMAKPVIATAAGGIPEIIENNKDGIMISPKDENALAEAIMKLYKNKEERYLLGSSALRKAADKFDIQKRIEVLEGVYS